MESEHVIKFDKRPLLKILYHYILLRHTFVLTFLFSSIFIPFHVRISKFFLLLNLNWCINAILYTDDLIEQRNIESNKIFINVKLFIKFTLILLIFIFNFVESNYIQHL